MPKEEEKRIRDDFREAVFSRDKYTCRACGTKSSPALAARVFDAHHITDRHEMPNGGYVVENGITLCKTRDNAGAHRLSCHEKAEQLWPGLRPDELYEKIGSSYKTAWLASGQKGKP